MKINIFKILLFTGVTIAMMSCNDDDKDEAEVNMTENEVTNRWIYDKMKRIYLWNDKLATSYNYNKAPKDFFYKDILYKYKQDVNGDMFSWMEEDKSKSNSTKSLMQNSRLGFDYRPLSYFSSGEKGTSSLPGFFVVYVYEGSDAEAKGLKRGQVIYKVNDTNISYSNYETILDNSTLKCSVYDNDGIKKDLQAFRANEEVRSPVLISKVIEQSGIKIGYLLYDAFERGSDENDLNNYDYDIKLINSIKDLNNRGITEFVLDLRYNPGGYLTSAMDLASALYPNRKGKIFLKEEYNTYFSDSLVARSKTDDIFNEYFLEKVYGTNVEIPKLNISKLYIIATEYSASASEAVINGLKAHMPVYHIGTTTVGKDKASTTVKSDDKRIKWQLQPLISRLTDVNGKGNYIYGLQPDIQVSEWDEGYTMVDAKTTEGDMVQIPLISDWIGGLQPLGEISEPLLAEAISHITGIPREKRTKSTKTLNVLSARVPVLKNPKEHKQVILIDADKFAE